MITLEKILKKHGSKRKGRKTDLKKSDKTLHGEESDADFTVPVA
jgi:hypothetical protein